MNRVDRLFAILLRLGSGKVTKARELAEEFGLSERTIYWDVGALAEIGVPIHGEAGVGYRLAPGYFLTSIAFTAEEARAISELDSHNKGSGKPGAVQFRQVGIED
jgi:predicted DNA-binding transcriptional regulator YafY